MMKLRSSTFWGIMGVAIGVAPWLTEKRGLNVPTWVVLVGGIIVLASVSFILFPFLESAIGRIPQWKHVHKPLSFSISLGIVVSLFCCGALWWVFYPYPITQHQSAQYVIGTDIRLRNETVEFVKELRAFTSDTLKGIELKYGLATPSVDYVDKGQYITLDRQSVYEQVYRGRAKSLRSQFENTLPCRSFGQSDPEQYKGTSIGAMRYVADDLERLATMLPN